jgi:hypothetical protein
VRLIVVWWLDCGHQVEPDPAEMAERYGGEDRPNAGDSPAFRRRGDVLIGR